VGNNPPAIFRGYHKSATPGARTPFKNAPPDCMTPLSGQFIVGNTSGGPKKRKRRCLESVWLPSPCPSGRGITPPDTLLARAAVGFHEQKGGVNESSTLKHSANGPFEIDDPCVIRKYGKRHPWFLPTSSGSFNNMVFNRLSITESPNLISPLKKSCERSAFGPCPGR